MKKIFALALAATMASGMTTVAFAADPKVTGVEFTGNAYYDVNGNDVLDDAALSIETGATPAAGTELGDKIIPGGTTIYLEVQAEYDDAGTYGPVNKLSDVSKWKIATDWTVGDKAEAPKFVNVKVNGSYGIYLALELPENDTVKNKDLLGTIGLGKTSTEAKKAAADDLAKLVITYGRDRTNDGSVNADIDNFTGDFGAQANFATAGAIVDFDNDADEIDIEFNDLAMFTVDVRGQGNLDLRFNTKFNAEFGDMYDYANIDFLTFSGSPRFNRTGTMVIYCENEDAFIYEVTADGAKEIRGAKYDEDEGGFVFKTRALGSYAISDVELDEKVVTEEKEESSKPASSNSGNSGKPNPDTGR